MESNKSKGVEAIIHAIVLAMPQLKELPTHAPEHMELVRDAVAEVVYNSLAHPQQSEATLTDHAISIGTPIQTTAAAVGGSGAGSRGVDG